MSVRDGDSLSADVSDRDRDLDPAGVIARGWAGYPVSSSPSVPEWERGLARDSFYAGATVVYLALQEAVTSGGSVGEVFLRIQSEIVDYSDMKTGRKVSGKNTH